jgi:hypothetical protein
MDETNEGGQFGSVRVVTETGVMWHPACCAYCRFFTTKTEERATVERLPGRCLWLPVPTPTHNGHWCGQFKPGSTVSRATV